MREMIEKIIKKIILEILEENELEADRIILFGSRARGDYKKNSDWDLLIVIKNKLSRKEKTNISHLIRRKLAEKFIPCDVLIKSEEEVKEREKVVGSVIKSVMKEGIVL